MDVMYSYFKKTGRTVPHASTVTAQMLSGSLWSRASLVPWFWVMSGAVLRNRMSYAFSKTGQETSPGRDKLSHELPKHLFFLRDVV